MDHQASRSLTLFTVLLSLVWNARLALSATLTGDFVCTRLQTYNVVESALLRAPYLIRENVWCAKIPPRCVKTRTEYRLEVIYENVTKTRVVTECCPVYWLKDETTCAPQCYGNFEGCGDHGTCVASDVCKCQPGFHGAQCNQGYEFHQLPDSSPTFRVSSTLEMTVSTPQYSSPSSTTVRPTLTMIVMPRTTTLESEPTRTESTVQFEILSSNSSQFSPPADLALRNLDEQAEPPVTEIPLTTLEAQSDISSPEISSTVVIDSSTLQIQNTPLSTTEMTIPTTQVETSSSESTTQIEPTTINFLESNHTTDDFYETYVNTTEQNSSDSVVTQSDKQNNSSISNSKFHQSISTVDPELSSSVSPRKTSSISHLVVVSSNETSLSNNYFMHMDLMTTLTVIIGTSCAVVLLSLLAVLLCHHRANRRKTAPMIVRPTKCESKSPGNGRHSQVPLPPTPLDLSGICSSGGLLIVHQHVTMATTNTFKPGSLQPTISPALREALESHYDHPAPAALTLRRQRISLDSGQKSPSVEKLWDAVVNATVSGHGEQNDAPEHLYDEIPCWNPQVYANSPSSTLQTTTRC